jgi:hypothetical protein
MTHTKSHDSDEYSEEEADQRFLTAVKTALATPPKPQKNMTRKGVAAQSKPSKKSPRR